MLPIDFSSQKTQGAKFLGHFDSQFRIYGHFQVFSKKFQRSIFPFRVFAVPVSRKMLLLLQFLRYQNAVCGILRTTKLATKCWEKIFEFLPPNFFRAPQSTKKIFEKKLTLEGSKNFWGQKSKFCSYRFFNNFVVGILPEFEVDILITVGGYRFSLNLFFYRKKIQHCKLITVRIFKMSLIDSPIEAL